VEPDQSAVEQESVDETASLKTKSARVKVDVAIVGDARDRESVVDAMTTVSDIYDQCQIQLETTVRELPNENAVNVDSSQRYALTNKYADVADDQETMPTVFVIGSTAERSVAFSYLPSLRRDVSNTAWVSDRVSQRCLAWIVGHEIGHILLDNASHHPSTRNVMNARCSANNNFNRSSALPRWTKAQCEALRSGSTLPGYD